MYFGCLDLYCGCGDLYRITAELDIPSLFANYHTFFGTGPVCLSALGGCYVSTAFRLCCVKYVLGDHELRSSGACSGGASCGYLRQGMAVGAFDGVAQRRRIRRVVSGGNATPWGGGRFRWVRLPAWFCAMVHRCRGDAQCMGAPSTFAELRVVRYSSGVYRVAFRVQLRLS